METQDKVYLKLGPKAASFYDPKTGIKLCHGEVVETTQVVADSTKVNRHLMAGGLKVATERDYKSYLEAVEALKPAVPTVTDKDDDYIADLENKTKESLEIANEAKEKAEEEAEKRLAAEKKAIYFQIKAEYELDAEQEAELEKISNNKGKLEAYLKELEDTTE